MSFVPWDGSWHSWGMRNALMEFICSSFIARSRVWPWWLLTRGYSHLRWVIWCLSANNQKGHNRAARAEHMAHPTCPSCSLNRVVDRGRECVAKTQMGNPAIAKTRVINPTQCAKWHPVWAGGLAGRRPLPLIKQNPPSPFLQAESGPIWDYSTQWMEK